MGKGECKEFENTFGATENTLFEPQEKEQLIDPDLVLELKDNKIKFTESNLLFVTKDETGQTIFLETGNKSSGLEHIKYGDGSKSFGHLEEIKSHFKIKEEEIPKILYNVISQGCIIKERPSVKGGFDRIYNYQGKNTFITVADNGFVVTVYPVGSIK